LSMAETQRFPVSFLNTYVVSPEIESWLQNVDSRRLCAGRRVPGSKKDA
jgi:hypothetical protein